MGNITLQELSRQYAAGELNKQDYRRRRRSLINEITGDEEEIDAPQVISNTATQPSLTLRYLALIIIGIVVAAIAFL